jgi:serine/threonine protein kinase
VETPLPTTDISRPTVTFSRLPPDPEADGAAPTVGWTIAGPPTAPDIGGGSDSSASTVLSFGEYLVVSEIGEGGMGRVYKAIDRNLGRHVAVKVLRSTDPFESSRFRGEAEMIAMLSHPNIVQIFAIDTAPDGRPYIALEFAEGGSLDRELKGQPIEPRRAAEMTEVLARAVHFAHEKGVIHRDLKPANVLRGKGGVLKLTDFGLAKQFEVSSGMTPSGAVMGTPSYMAPEQAEGKAKQLGPAVDVYGVGAILYEMLTGRPPFRGANLVETLEMVRWAEPASPTQLVPRLHRDLATICLKCLRKTPAQRYATAGDLADDLRHWLNGETIVARSAASWEKVWRQVRRRPWQAATAAMALLAAAALVVGGLFYYDHEQKNTARERQAAHEREIAENKAAEQERLDALRRDGMEKLRTRSQASLGALDNIREMMLRGRLRNVRDLDPLRSSLFVYYKNLNERLKGEEGCDRGALARSWLEVGKLIHETGPKDDAWEAYHQANELYRAEAADTPESRLNRAEAEGKCGRLAFELNRITDAKSSCAEVARLLEGLPVVNRKAAGELAEMWHLRGEIYDRERDLDGALPNAVAAYDRAIDFRLKALGDDRALAADQFFDLARREPARFDAAIENLRGLARDHAYQAGVLLDANELARADKAYWQAHRIREQVRNAIRPVAAALDKYRLELALAESHFSRGPSNCARVQIYCRALATAEHFAAQALELRKEVSKANPNNIEFSRDVCDTSNLVAELKLLLGEYDTVGECLDAAVKVPKDLPDDKGGYTVEALGILARARLFRGQYLAYRPAPDLEGSKNEIREAVKLFDKLKEKNPSDPTAAFHRASMGATRAANLNATLTSYETIRKDFEADALRELELAIQLGYREKHPDDIREMRSFAKLKGNPKFEELLGRLRALREPTREAAVRTPAASP